MAAFFCVSTHEKTLFLRKFIRHRALPDRHFAFDHDQRSKPAVDLSGLLIFDSDSDLPVCRAGIIGWALL